MITSPHQVEGADLCVRRATISRVERARTELASVGNGSGPAHFWVAATPDHDRARLFALAAGRLVWQRLHIGPDRADAVVAAVRQRRPAFLPVSMPTALGLLHAGLPTVATAPGPPS